MTVATLDTHEVVKDLLAAGFTDDQAEAVARNLRKARDLDFSTLATKVDIADLRGEMERFAVGSSEIKCEIIKWTFGVVGLQTLVILGTLIKLVKP